MTHPKHACVHAVAKNCLFYAFSIIGRHDNVDTNHNEQFRTFEQERQQAIESTMMAVDAFLHETDAYQSYKLHKYTNHNTCFFQNRSFTDDSKRMIV